MLKNILLKNPTKLARQQYRNSQGRTLLQLAVEEKEIDALISLIVNDGLDVNERSYNGETALFDAARFGDNDIIFILYELGADVNSYSNDNDSPLLWAVYKKHDLTAELLLLLGADPHHKYIDQRDAFLWAIRQDNVCILKYLCENYPAINMNAVDRDYKSWETIFHSEDMQTCIDNYKLKNKMYLYSWFKQQVCEKSNVERHILKIMINMYTYT